MSRRMFRLSLLAATIALGVSAPASVAIACGASSAGEGAGGCPTCTAACNTCNLPTTHQIVIPGVTVTPPSINVGSPTLGCDTCGFNTNGGGFGSINVTVNVQQTAQASATSSSGASSTGLSNAAAANLITGGGGGGGFVDTGPSTSITNLTVISNDQPQSQSRQVCVAEKSAIAVYAVQAVCLDDKATPHPASQTNADRDLVDSYRGEVFRCIAGSHMQYTVAAYAGGAANFDHGQTKVCAKGDALWREADGSVQCRPQTPARDCNERSLLRRYGAGIKVLKIVGGKVCAAYRTETYAAAQGAEISTPGQSFVGSGGVGW